MHRIKILAVLFLLLSSAIVSAQYPGTNTNIVLVQGEPPLTQEMVRKLAIIYEIILDVKFTAQQHEYLQHGMMEYWITKNNEAIEQCFDNLKYYGQHDVLEALRNSSQAAIIESLRRDILETHDAVSIVLVEAFDKAHADRAKATKAKTFDDLIGRWKQTDYLLQQKNAWDNSAAGVGYTNTEIFEITAGGKFKLVKVHDHYSNGCDQQTASTQAGIIIIKGTNLDLKIEEGSSETNDNCKPQFNKRKAIEPHTETFAWSVRLNPNNEKAMMLCINMGKDSAVCYEKQ